LKTGYDFIACAAVGAVPERAHAYRDVRTGCGIGCVRRHAGTGAWRDFGARVFGGEERG
jgi:hypothetical protein